MFASIDCSVCGSRFGLRFADKTLQAKPLQRRQGLYLPGERWHDPHHGASAHLTQSCKPAAVLRTCVVHGKSPGRHNHPTLLGEPMKSTGAGRVKADFQRGNPIWRRMKPGGSPCWDSAASVGAPMPTPVIRSPTLSAPTQPCFFTAGWRVLNAWRRAP